jgi:hypothetical protein
MLSANELASKVIGATGGARIKQLFRLDTQSYDWIDDFLRDKAIRGNIDTLRKKIAETQQAPIHRDELRAQFVSRLKQIKAFQVKQVGDWLREVQTGGVHMFNELTFGERRVLGAPFLPFLMGFTKDEEKEIFKGLPEGVRQKDKMEQIEECQAEIAKLEAKITEELSPRSRWLHRENGEPFPYPQGCRWTTFVKTWELISARFSGPVDLNGWRIANEDELKAYYALGLDKVHKLPPLREPI